MSTTEHLVCRRHDGIAELVLNRPERYNALSHALARDLRHRLEELEADEAVRAILITGAGKAFCSGADLKGGPSDPEEVLRTFYLPLVELMDRMETPIVAAVNGVAAGAGLSIVLCADLRVAADVATFSMAFVKVGLVPDAGASWLLPRAVGSARAAEMALLGRKVSAAQALAWNLVNEVVPVEQVRARGEEIALELARLSASVGATRRLLHDSAGRSLSAQLDAEASAQGRAQHHPHYAEARLAFTEKRSPVFR